MTSVARSINQLSYTTPILLVLAAVAWAGTLSMAKGMGSMPGTMGMGVGSFTIMWGIMMSAMMLPSVVPFASLYTRTFKEHGVLRLAVLTSGYLLVWTLSALPAYVLAMLSEKTVSMHVMGPTILAIIVFIACGMYQLTPLKDKCLSHCRSPLGDLLKYAAYTGRIQDFRVGISHGIYCLGCCWALMLLLVSFGFMNITAMVALTVIFMIEKLWTKGALFSQLLGVASLSAAIVVLIWPELTPVGY